MKVSWIKYPLKFKFEAGTSRGVLTTKKSYFVFIKDETNTVGVGECSFLPGLSIDDRPDTEQKLEKICEKLRQLPINNIKGMSVFLKEEIGNVWPSLRMGFETAFLDYFQRGKRVIFKNDFLKGEGIPINGLIWMGDRYSIFPSFCR